MAGVRTEILFVDDSTDDETFKRARLAHKSYRTSGLNIRLYHRVGDLNWGGLSGAVADGLSRARSDKVVIMDGDLQHPPETIPTLLAASASSDMVIASRYCKGGSAKGLDGRLRHLVSGSSTLFAKSFFPLRLRKVTDPMTGFFLVDRTKVDLGRLRPKGFKILLEILATHQDLSVTEIPFEFAERNAGKSNGSVKQGLEFVSQMVGLRLGRSLRLFGRLPKFIQFGAVGGSVFLLGTALLFAMVEGLSWSPLAANAIQLAVTFWLNYLLNRNITWRERTVSRLAAHKFLVSRAVTTALSYLLFAWLISTQYTLEIFGSVFDFSINYLAANVITLLTVMVVNYEISDRWAFADVRHKDKATSLRKHPAILYAATALAALAGTGILLGLVPVLTAMLVIAGLLLFAQASLEVWRMAYVYREPGSSNRLRFPKPRKPRERFCIIVPARHESAVLGATLQQLALQTHPDVHIVAVICDDDYDTLLAAYDIANKEARVTVMQYPLQPGDKPSKPKQLNYVFRQIKGQGYSVIGVIDAEDTVHPELLRHIDTAFRDRQTSIVQGGVQLMNHDSSWYSLHNVLEYYRWFNSAMAFQADSRFMPLGGNTVFIREALLRKAGGWPETLTEDCSLGVLLSTKYHAKTRVYYEPRLATREETPDTLQGLFKQRVRWNQGFFHEWRKGVWRGLPQARARLLANYILLGPVVLAVVSLFIPLSLLSVLLMDVPVALAMVMYLPFVPLTLLFVLNAIFLHDFGNAFQRRVGIRHYVVLLATYVPYQLILNAAALWSVVRELRGEQSWYKTAHNGQHRTELAYAGAGAAEIVQEKRNG